MKEGIWLKKFIRDLGVVPSICDHVEIFYDNEGGVSLNKEPISHKNSRHILRKSHYIIKLVEDAYIIESRVSSKQNLVDPFTKPLSSSKCD